MNKWVVVGGGCGRVLKKRENGRIRTRGPCPERDMVFQKFVLRSAVGV